MANSYLSKDFGSAGNKKTMTFSFWVKRGTVTADGDQFIGDAQTGYPSHFILFQSDDKLSIRSQAGVSGATLRFTTLRKFIDTTAWYHIVIAIDTTQASADDRCKVWVNGVQETAFSTSDQTNGFGQNSDTYFNNGDSDEYIGKYASDYARFTLAHYHFVDGTAYTPSTFGETDSTTGIWKPKTSPSVTYGTHGFFLKFENSGALGTDSSGNSKTWTVNGNLRQSISTPNDKFPNLNPRGTANGYGTAVYTLDSGTTALMTTGVNRVAPIDMCFQGGKWYWECKIEKANMSATLGVYMTDFSSAKRIEQFNADLALQSASVGGKRAVSFLADSSSSKIQNAGSTVTYGANCSDGDIIMFAFDSATGKVWTGRNGTWNNAPGTSNVGDPAAGTNDSGTVLTNTDNDLMSFYISGRNSDSTNRYMYINFGHGYFGTTAVASTNADGNGKGSFEYAPPTGFLALCSSNIQSDGG
jgi:hypothetical protein